MTGRPGSPSSGSLQMGAWITWTLSPRAASSTNFSAGTTLMSPVVERSVAFPPPSITRPLSRSSSSRPSTTLPVTYMSLGSTSVASHEPTAVGP